MPDIASRNRGVFGFLRSLAGDLDSEEAASQDIANYQQALRKNMLDNWHQGPPQQFYDQVQTKLQDPAFHSRVVGDVVKAMDPGLRDAGADAAATAFTMSPKGMAASYLAGLVADPSAANFANTAFQIADPMQASPGGGFSLAGTPIARIPAGEQALARLKTYARDASDIQKQLFHGVINARDRLFHATDTGGFKGILESGEISPNPWLHQGMGAKAQKQMMAQQADKKKLAEQFAKHPMQTGWADEAKQQFVITGDGAPWASMDTLDIAKAKVADYKAKHPETTFEISPEPAETFHHPLHDGIEITKILTSGGGYKYDASIPSGYVGTFSSVSGAEKGIADALKQEAQLAGQSNPEAGVSVSRVPRISPKSSKAISFVLDPNEVPPMRPLAEQGYQKTREPMGGDNWYDAATPAEQQHYQDLWDTYTGAHTSQEQATASKAYADYAESMKRKYATATVHPPNKNFEYELRTFNEPIPLEGKHGRPAATEIWVDKSALEHGDPFDKNVQMQLTQHPEYQRFIAEQATANPGRGWPWENPSHKLQVDDNVRFFMSSHPQANDILKDIRIMELRQQAAERGLPLRVFPSGPAMHAARVGQYASDPAAATSFGVWGGKQPKPVSIEAAPVAIAQPLSWWPDYVKADYVAGLLNKDSATTKAVLHGYSPEKPASASSNQPPQSVLDAVDAWNTVAKNVQGGGKKAKKKLAEIPPTPTPPATPAWMTEQQPLPPMFPGSKLDWVPEENVHDMFYTNESPWVVVQKHATAPVDWKSKWSPKTPWLAYNDMAEAEIGAFATKEAAAQAVEKHLVTKGK